MGLFLSVQAAEKVGSFSSLLFQMWEDYNIERANNYTEVSHLWSRIQELGLVYTILCHQHRVNSAVKRVSETSSKSGVSKSQDERSLCISWMNLFIHAPFMTMSLTCRSWCREIFRFFVFSENSFIWLLHHAEFHLHKDLQGVSESKSHESNLWVKYLTSTVIMEQRR